MSSNLTRPLSILTFATDFSILFLSTPRLCLWPDEVFCYNRVMNQNILFVDGENFLHKVEDVLKEEKVDLRKVDLGKIDLNSLIKTSLKSFKIKRKIFYVARLHFNQETGKKSSELINFQRRLKTNLEKQGFKFLIAGNVRAQIVKVDHKTKVIFREKGVDVKIAVDLISYTADKLLETAILCSSDSDLQPAVKELHKRKVEVVYLGFEINPNKGLTYTANHTILFRNSEITKACSKK